MSTNTQYRDVFFAADGFGPYECFLCGEPITFDQTRERGLFLVHHLNHDETDHRIENLAAAHRRCHMAHHIGGVPRPHDLATRKKISEGLRLAYQEGRRSYAMSDHARKKISETLKGRDTRKEARDARGS